MDCRIAVEYINLYADNMLNEKETAQLLSHIGSCGKCRKDLDDILAVKKALAGLGEIKPPAGLAIAAIRKANKRRLPVFAYASAGIAAVITLAVVFSSGIFNNSSNSPKDRLAEAPKALSESFAAGATMQDESVQKAPDMYYAPAPEATMAATSLPAASAEPAAEDSGVQEDYERSSSVQYVYVPDEAPKNYKESFEGFLADNNIQYSKSGDAYTYTVSFTITEDKLVTLKSFIEESFQGRSFVYGAFKDEMLRDIEELKAGLVNFIFKK